MRYLLLLLLPVLAACEQIPEEVTVVGCAAAPAHFPDLAEEIAAACILQAATQ